MPEDFGKITNEPGRNWKSKLLDYVPFEHLMTESRRKSHAAKPAPLRRRETTTDGMELLSYAVPDFAGKASALQATLPISRSLVKALKSFRKGVRKTNIGKPKRDFQFIAEEVSDGIKVPYLTATPNRRRDAYKAGKELLDIGKEFGRPITGSIGSEAMNKIVKKLGGTIDPIANKFKLPYGAQLGR